MAAGGVSGRGPSSPARRAVVAALALAGAAIASYLALVQLGVVARAWDPLFGAGARRVLFSAVSRALPVPDAAVGALGYVTEVALDLAGGARRWREQPGLVLAFGAVVAAMAGGGVALALMQAFVLRAGCTLCLASAALSVALAVLAAEEVRAALGHVRREQRAGRPLWQILRGEAAARA